MTVEGSKPSTILIPQLCEESLFEAANTSLISGGEVGLLVDHPPHPTLMKGPMNRLIHKEHLYSFMSNNKHTSSEADSIFSW